MDRERPPLVGDERSMVLGWLNWHRQALAGKCDGLTVADLKRRSVPPSELSLLGLVRHMIQMELTRLHWYRYGRAALPYGEHDFDQADEADPHETLRIWEEVMKTSDAIVVAAVTLDDVGAVGTTLRFNLLSLTNEYARHNGHADLLRECIDGTVGE